MENYLKLFSSELSEIQQNNQELSTKIQKAEEILQKMSQQESTLESKQSKRQSWTNDEHTRFLKAYFAFTKEQPKEIEEAIGTRDIRQVYSHIQKYELKIKSFIQDSLCFAQQHCAFVANHLAACSISLPRQLTPTDLLHQIEFVGQYTNACVQFFCCKHALEKPITDRVNSILSANFGQITNYEKTCEAYCAFWLFEKDYLQASGMILELIKLIDLFDGQSSDPQEYIILNSSRILGLSSDEVACLWRSLEVIYQVGTFRQ